MVKPKLSYTVADYSITQGYAFPQYIMTIAKFTNDVQKKCAEKAWKSYDTKCLYICIGIRRS